VEPVIVDEDTYGSDDCLAATRRHPPTHRCNKSQSVTPNHSTMTLSIVISTRSNWLQCSDKVI
jgi:hypothetical protein